MKKTIPLDEGTDLVAKKMVGTGGTPFPQHSASHESVLLIVDGSCTITFPHVVRELQTGDTFIVPAHEVHQVVGTPDFAAVHVMPKNIRFTFTT